VTTSARRRVSEPKFLEQLEALGSLREPTRRRLYDFVERRPTPVSRDEAADTLGISRAMAAFHLDRLVEVGLLRAHYRRLSGRAGRGAGRPSKLYSRSRHQFAVSLPERNHALLARLLAEPMTHSEAGPAPDLPATRYGRSLGVRARRRISRRATGERTVGCVEDVLEELGFEPFRIDDGSIRARNCPFDPLSRRYPSVVCRTAVAMIDGLIEGVGSPGMAVSRDERPDRCCIVLGHGAQASRGDGVSINARDMR
jgi:predicted ArsR family transcriptional regulator